MKRVFYLGIMIGLLTVLVAPFELSGGEGVVASLKTANAAQSVGSATPADEYVCVALPPLSGMKQKDCPAGEIWIDNDPVNGGAIIVYLRAVLRLLSTAVGLVIILMIVISGVQYITSTADPSRVKAAKERLQNAIIALVLFLMMFAILTFLIPGGILR